MRNVDKDLWTEIFIRVSFIVVKRNLKSQSKFPVGK